MVFSLSPIDIEKYLATQNIKASSAAIANARETLAGKLRGYISIVFRLLCPSLGREQMR
jgi:hypothetical protein